MHLCMYPFKYVCILVVKLGQVHIQLQMPLLCLNKHLYKHSDKRCGWHQQIGENAVFRNACIFRIKHLLQKKCVRVGVVDEFGLHVNTQDIIQSVQYLKNLTACEAVVDNPA